MSDGTDGGPRCERTYEVNDVVRMLFTVGACDHPLLGAERAAKEVVDQGCLSGSGVANNDNDVLVAHLIRFPTGTADGIDQLLHASSVQMITNGKLRIRLLNLLRGRSVHCGTARLQRRSFRAPTMSSETVIRYCIAGDVWACLKWRSFRAPTLRSETVIRHFIVGVRTHVSRILVFRFIVSVRILVQRGTERFPRRHAHVRIFTHDFGD
mmetsp:Transcript_83565/g.139485  ORF Transcript_83565/g.139485 Transcript_83565/m.139485 type:complete len:210 (+) Transcript_83565:1793-2422(+)